MVFWSVIFSAVLGISVILALRYKATDLEYAPRDTRVIPFTRTFCQRLSITSPTNSHDYNPSLYLLSSPPKLIAHDTFAYSKDLTVNSVDDFDFNYYYLYPGSRINVSACLSDDSSSGVIFYIIKGHKNFKSWTKYESSSMYTWRKVIISDKCSSARNKTYTYDIKSEDYYFLVFDFPISGVVKIQTDFNCTRYSFSNESVLDSCTLRDSTHCSIGIPLSESGNTALLTVQPAPGHVIDWSDDGISLDINCSPRIWTYVIVFVVCVFVLLILLLFFKFALEEEA